MLENINILICVALVLIAGWMIWIDRRVRTAVAVAEQAKLIGLSAHTRLDAHSKAQGILLDDLRREDDDDV